MTAAARRPCAPVPLRLAAQEDVEELQAVLAAAAELTSEGSVEPLTELGDYGAAGKALGLAWQAIAGALAGAGAVREHVLSSAGLVELLGRVHRLDGVLREAESAHRHRSLNLVREALGRFRGAETVAQIMRLAPETVCGLGFDRSLLSEVDGSTWVTRFAHMVGDSAWAEIVAQVGRDNPQPLGPRLRETELVRRRSPLLVVGAQQDPNIHRKVAEASMTRSYVAAPFTVQDRVVGFLHCDRYFQRGDVDEFDRDLLATFTEGLSASLERASLHQRLLALRGQLQQVVDGVELSSTWAVEEFDPRSSAVAEHDPAAALTRRERQVLQLMAAGETNGRIATQLVLSEATVKSHVKHILRKLGAANRAEAVSRWLTAGRRSA